MRQRLLRPGHEQRARGGGQEAGGGGSAHRRVCPGGRRRTAGLPGHLTLQHQGGLVHGPQTRKEGPRQDHRLRGRHLRRGRVPVRLYASRAQSAGQGQQDRGHLLVRRRPGGDHRGRRGPRRRGRRQARRPGPARALRQVLLIL